MSVFQLDAKRVDRLAEAIKNFPGNAEAVINEEFQNYAAPLIQESIRRLMPESHRTWKGKKAPAKTGNSLRADFGNLFVITRTTKQYQYLYFPNSGENTRRHAGQQFFFERGVEAVEGDIVDRCVARLVESFGET